MHDELCGKCGLECDRPENEYGEFICASCEQDAAEAAWERHQDWLMENGPGPTLAEQQETARRLK
jgi:hypothetical protein